MNARLLNLLGLGLVCAIGIAFLVLVPRLFELDVVLELTVYMIMAILALSLALIWGYGGILCFGQSAFFGLGAYTYAIAMFNIGESTIPLLLAIVLPAAFAALLGYFMFYGRISDVYLGVITLTVTLILFNSVNSTAGPEFHIGSARLGGFNGIPGIPPLNFPGNKATPIDLAACVRLLDRPENRVYAWRFLSRLKERIRTRARQAPEIYSTDALDQVRTVAAGSGNLLYPIREALSVSATLGEICDVLRGVFGVYQPRESF